MADTQILEEEVVADDDHTRCNDFFNDFQAKFKLHFSDNDNVAVVDVPTGKCIGLYGLGFPHNLSESSKNQELEAIHMGFIEGVEKGHMNIPVHLKISLKCQPGTFGIHLEVYDIIGVESTA